MGEPLLECEDLTIQYQTRKGPVTAVSGASFSIEKGQYFGLAGESGCGKSTIAKAVMGGLDDNGTVASGTIRYQGEEIQDFSEAELNRKIRWKEISLIPQSSMNSLDPLQRVRDQAIEVADVHTDMTRQEALDRLRELFDVVGLQQSRIGDYPHQFSGGMQQRAIIAFALLLDPDLIVADEPTTALDVIMQDQIFKYLDRIKHETDTGMLLITHDISVIFESCDNMAIMHAGQIAESGTVSQLYDSPSHPYSLLLQRSFPDHRYPDRELEVIEGNPPQLFGEVNACAFADRCPWVVDECRAKEPPLEAVSPDEADHRVACFRTDAVQAESQMEPANPDQSD